MTKYILAIYVLGVSCFQCPDRNFEMKFAHTLKKLELLKNNGITPTNTMDSVKIASRIIEMLTGIRPKISYNYTVTYLEKDYKSDSIQWHTWYHENKCKITEATYDTICNRAKTKYLIKT
jgi:hypothetical protein